MAQTPTTETLLSEAYVQAANENKNIMVIFHASWCGWCKKLLYSLDDKSCKKMIDDNYVLVLLTINESPENKNFENPGAIELATKYKGDQAGLPFFVILNKKGELIGDSFIRKNGEGLDSPGENMGCPAAAEEVKAFCDLLKKTSRLNERDLKIIAARFKKNK